MCSHPSKYRFSSYRYYAFGVINEWTEHITPPKFYLEMGDTPEARQAEYRRQCDEYWREKKLPEERQLEHGHALGSEKFVRNRHRLMLALGGHLRHKTWPRRDRRRMAARLLILEPRAIAADARTPDEAAPESRTPDVLSPGRQVGAGAGNARQVLSTPSEPTFAPGLLSGKLSTNIDAVAARGTS